MIFILLIQLKQISRYVKVLPIHPPRTGLGVWKNKLGGE